jgi:hypothetical protein
MRVVKCLPLVFALGVVASEAGVAQPSAAFPGLLAIPTAAGEPEVKDVTVVYQSDGYRLTNCLLVGSTGSDVADAQACKTVNFRRSKKPVEAKARVWVPRPFSGSFVAPIAANDQSKWFGLSDYPETSAHGTLVIRQDLDALGRLTSCQVAASSGLKALDSHVRRIYCGRARFRPATLDGVAVASIVFAAIRLTNGD